MSAPRQLADPVHVNKWVNASLPAEKHVEQPDAPWVDPDRAVLEHMREILGFSLFSGCGQPDCFDCAED